jgi:hypothetical protein
VYPSKIPSKERDSNLTRLWYFRTKYLHKKTKVKDRRLSTETGMDNETEAQDHRTKKTRAGGRPCLAEKVNKSPGTAARTRKINRAQSILAEEKKNPDEVLLQEMREQQEVRKRTAAEQGQKKNHAPARLTRESAR